MIYLITAPPGSGKTLFMVYQIDKMLKAGETRPIFANISGLKLDHEPSPDDWRETPEGSIVIYDEAQKTFPSDGRSGVAQDDRIRAMETHRHTGHDIWLITQHPTLINQHIRKLVGKHYHIHRAAGFNRATLWEWDEAVSNPRGGSEKNRATSTETFSYPKEIFDLYQSTTLNTHKPKIPRKLLYLVGMVVLILLFVAYNGVKAFKQFDRKLDPTLSDPAPATMSPGRPTQPKARGYEALVAETFEYDGHTIVTGGCIVSDDDCGCWAIDGRIIDINRLQCDVVARSRPRRPLLLEYAAAVPVDYSTGLSDTPHEGRRLPEAQPGQPPEWGQ